MTMTPKVVLLALAGLAAEVMAGTLPAFHPSADTVAGTGDRKILGPRKWFERSHMTPPLSACAIVAFAGEARNRAAIAEVLRHYDYSTLNISEFFLAELAWYALPDPAGTDGKGTDK